LADEYIAFKKAQAQHGVAAA